MADAQRKVEAIARAPGDETSDQPDDFTRLALSQYEKLTPTKRADALIEFTIRGQQDQIRQLEADKRHLLMEKDRFQREQIPVERELAALQENARWRSWWEGFSGLLTSIGGVLSIYFAKPSGWFYMGFGFIVLGSVMTFLGICKAKVRIRSLPREPTSG